MSNQADHLEEEDSTEYAAKLESDYDKLLLENANLTQRVSQYVGVFEDILQIANSDANNKKSSKSIYGTEYIESFNSLNDISFIDLKMQAPNNYFEPPTTFQ